MKKLALKFFLILVALGIAGYLRFDALDRNPMHADEATGAKILSERLENQLYRFDPSHFHGPLLTALTLPLARARGELDWRTLRTETLRCLPALAGFLTVGLVLFWRKALGEGGVLWTMLFLATSPILVTYSRIYIHETLLAFVSLLTLTFFWAFVRQRAWGWLIATGVGMGLMFATKETFIITLGVWCIATLMLCAQFQSVRDDALQRLKIPSGWWWILMAALAALFSSAWFYSDGFSQPEAIGDAYRTYFVYKTTLGHEKPWFYYLHLLAWPKVAGGRVWQESSLALMFVLGAIFNFFHPPLQRGSKFYVARFMLYSAIGHILAYSLISYKTPWLMVLPWVHVCIFAGLSVASIGEAWPRIKIFCWALLLPLLFFQFQQTYLATHRYACDARNPNVYVPSSKDVLKLEALVVRMNQTQIWPEGALVAVLGQSYWPLPWYLKSLKRVGYWANANDAPQLEKLEMVIAMPSQVEICGQKLAPTHQLLLYGLRDEFPMSCFIRRDLWHKYLELPE